MTNEKPDKMEKLSACVLNMETPENFFFFFLHFLAYNRFFSPLVCSTVRVGCCAGAEAMSGEKIDNNLHSDVYRDQDEQTQ